MKTSLFAAAACAALMVGCSSAGMSRRSIETSGSVDVVYRKQIFTDLSKFVDDEWATPTYADPDRRREDASNRRAFSNPRRTSSALSFNDRLAAAPEGLVRIEPTRAPDSSAEFPPSRPRPIIRRPAPQPDRAKIARLQSLYRYVVVDDMTLREPDPYVKAIYPSREPLRVYYRRKDGTDNMPRGGNFLSLGNYNGNELFITAEDHDRGELTRFIAAAMTEYAPSEYPARRAASGADPASRERDRA